MDRIGGTEESKVGRGYPNARDCEHGHQRGKCPECLVIELERELAASQLAVRLHIEKEGQMLSELETARKIIAASDPLRTARRLEADNEGLRVEVDELRALLEKSVALKDHVELADELTALRAAVGEAVLNDESFIRLMTDITYKFGPDPLIAKVCETVGLMTFKLRALVPGEKGIPILPSHTAALLDAVCGDDVQAAPTPDAGPAHVCGTCETGPERDEGLKVCRTCVAGSNWKHMLGRTCGPEHKNWKQKGAV